MRKSEKIIDLISDKRPMQKKYLSNVLDNIKKHELDDLEEYLGFMTYNYSLEEIADAYLLFVDDTLNETKYFVENGCERYRCSKYSEVADLVYNNSEYMRKYMIGLQLSGYIWINHLKIHRYYKEFLQKHNGKSYLEIGPGHGRYFLEAICEGGYENYKAVDISDTSLKMTAQYVNTYNNNPNANIVIEKGDFLEMPTSELYDAIVISEVLEHVEEPTLFLKKIYSILTPTKGIAYINVPINAPAVDHIFLYRTIEEFEGLVTDANLVIEEKFITTANDIQLEKAIKKKQAINLVLLVRKGQK